MAIPFDAPQMQAPSIAELGDMWSAMQAEKEDVKKDPKASQKRVAGVRRLVGDERLKTAGDYYFAAVIASEGQTADDALLAHDLSISALALGEQRARPLAATTEDRFLTRIGRSQRFGTQTTTKNGKSALLPTHPAVSDDMRRILNLPPLAVTKKLLAIGRKPDQIVPPQDTSRLAQARPMLANVD